MKYLRFNLGKADLLEEHANRNDIEYTYVTCVITYESIRVLIVEDSYEYTVCLVKKIFGVSSAMQRVQGSQRRIK